MDLTKAEMIEWQWHQLEHMQVICSRQTTMPAPHHPAYYRSDALPAAQLAAIKLTK